MHVVTRSRRELEGGREQDDPPRRHDGRLENLGRVPCAGPGPAAGVNGPHWRVVMHATMHSRPHHE